MREIEILVELHTDLELAKRTLKDFEFLGSKATLDRYFYDPLRTNLSMDGNNKLMECCRLRTKNGKHSVAYKIDNYDGETWLYSDEHETEIADAVEMLNIFRHLGLKELVVVNNIKHTYLKGPYELVLEEVCDLGVFLEVEYLNDDVSCAVEEIKNGIFEFIKSLNFEIGDELNSGKPELLLLKKRV